MFNNLNSELTMKNKNKFNQIKKIIFGVLFVSMSAHAALSDDTQTQTFDQNPGPLQIGLTYSNQFSAIVDSKWINYITPHNAFAFELNGGGQEFRIAGTLAHAITPEQRFKITAEHLAQNFTFGFAAGNHIQWVGQNAGGVSYQYLLLNHSVLRDVQVGAYISKAETENIDDTLFVTPAGTFLNLEHLTGASAQGGSVAVDVQPWQTALLGLGINYDNVHYATIYQSANSSSGLGATVTLEQLLSDHWKVDLMASPRQPYTQYQAATYWLLHTKPGSRLVLGLIAAHVNGDIPTSSESRVTFNVAYSWGGNPDSGVATFALPDLNNAADLTDYVAVPAVYQPAVLIEPEQRVVAHTP